MDVVDGVVIKRCCHCIVAGFDVRVWALATSDRHEIGEVKLLDQEGGSTSRA